MNTLKENTAFIRELKKAKEPVGCKSLDTDIYENLAYDYRTGMAIHSAWVFAPIISMDIRVCSQMPMDELKPKTLQAIRSKAYKLLVSKLASQYCKHPWFGMEKSTT